MKKKGGFKKHGKKHFHKKGKVFKKDDRELAIAKVHKYWMTNPSPGSRHLVVPPAYRTTLVSSWQCVMPAASNSKQTILIPANSARLPFNGMPLNLQTGLDEAGIFSTKSCAGFSNIFGYVTSLYQRYHCLGSKLKITLTPAALGDSVMICVAPTNGTGAQYGSSGSMEQGPYSKYKSITAGAEGKDRTISSSLDIPKFLGIPIVEYLGDIQYAGDLNTAITGGAPYLVDWQVIINTCDGLVTTVPMCAKFEVEYDIVCFQDATGALNDV